MGAGGEGGPQEHQKSDPRQASGPRGHQCGEMGRYDCLPHGLRGLVCGSKCPGSAGSALGGGGGPSLRNGLFVRNQSRPRSLRPPLPRGLAIVSRIVRRAVPNPLPLLGSHARTLAQPLTGPCRGGGGGTTSAPKAAPFPVTNRPQTDRPTGPFPQSPFRRALLVPIPKRAALRYGRRFPGPLEPLEPLTVLRHRSALPQPLIACVTDQTGTGLRVHAHHIVPSSGSEGQPSSQPTGAGRPVLFHEALGIRSCLLGERPGGRGRVSAAGGRCPGGLLALGLPKGPP